MSLTDPRDTEVLEQRATILARPRQRETAPRRVLDVLAVRLNGALFGVVLTQVAAVFRVGRVFPVPLVARHLLGIVRRQGRSLTLVSLRHFFEPAAEGLIDADYAVHVRVNEQEFAFQAEGIEGVSRIEAATVGRPPDNLDPGLGRYVSGLTSTGLLMLDLEALVAAEGFGSRRGRGGQ